MRALFLIACLLALGATPARAQHPDPVVVELYTAQGCEECWRANAMLVELSRRPDVVALTFPVDYWDYLGWKDTYAHPAFTFRQRLYKTALRLRDLRTPQVFVNGVSTTSGLDRRQVLDLIGAHRAAPAEGPIVRLGLTGDRVLVRSGRLPPGGAEVWLIRYDPRVTQVTVTQGDNKGRVVPHRNVVKELIRLGPWTGRGRMYALPPSRYARLRTAVVVQALRDRRIVAADAER
jgi:hypothetical protein